MTPAALGAQLERHVRANLCPLVNRHMIYLLVGRLRAAMPACIEGVVPEKIGLSLVTRAAKALVAQGICIRNLPAIVEAPDAAADSGATEGESIERAKAVLVG